MLNFPKIYNPTPQTLAGINFKGICCVRAGEGRTRREGDEGTGSGPGNEENCREGRQIRPVGDIEHSFNYFILFT